jgi:hypothetical protein
MTLAARPSRLLTDPVLPEMRQGVSFAVLAHAQLFTRAAWPATGSTATITRTPVAAGGAAWA